MFKLKMHDFQIYILIISCVIVTPLFASYRYQTESEGALRAFKELHFLYEYYNEHIGTYPVSDSNSTDMFKLAIFLNKNGPPKELEKNKYRCAQEGFLGICNLCFHDMKMNIELIKIQISGSGNPKAELLDFWGNPIQVILPGKKNTVDFYSLGKNGRLDDFKLDDIVSWDPNNLRYQKHYPVPLSFHIWVTWRELRTFLPFFIIAIILFVGVVVIYRRVL